MSTTNTPIANFVAAVIFVAVAAVGFLCLSSLYSEYDHANSSLRWPAVDGVIVFDVGINGTKDGSGEDSVFYEYAVGGKTYRSCVERFLESASLSRGQVGETIKVFYNPTNPLDACLSPGLSNITFSRFIVLVAFVSGFIFFLCRFLLTFVFPSEMKVRTVSREALS